MSLTAEPWRIDTTYTERIIGRVVATSQNTGSVNLYYAPFEPNRIPRRPWFDMDPESE